ncbi:hypothetical protein K439DRAFT_1386760 [Ramaria rubella]|nr:hypothetical protein K439DRAFT_1386760 [Ramaria rubella]
MSHDGSQAEDSGNEAEGSGQKPDLAYDPDQDIQEKREIRRDYRALLDETSELKANLKNVKISDIENGLVRGNRLFGKVKDTSEATLDSRYLMMASDMGAAKAKAMKSDAGGFDMDDFVSKLITYMGGRKGGLKREDSEGVEQQEEDEEDDDDGGDSLLDWEKVGRLALAKSHRVPVMDFMLGPLSTEQKQRKKVNRPKFEKNKEKEQKPQQAGYPRGLTEDDIQRAENETTKNVAMIEKVLRSQTKKLNFFQFVVNPGDFGQTVENLFYVSFLIREAKCCLEFDEDTGEPMIYSCKQPVQKDYDDGVRKQQIVLEMDMETWKYAIDVFKIDTCIIPNRKLVERNGERWYG